MEDSAQNIQLVDMNQWNGYNALEDIIDATGSSSLTMVEVGSYRGQSAEKFMLTGKVRRLYCVDPWDMARDLYYDKSELEQRREAERDFDRRMSRFCGRVVKVKGTLLDFIGINTDKIDLVYVDGRHDYEGVRADLLVFRNIIRPSIAYAGHDYGGDWHGVTDAVDEVLGSPNNVFRNSSWLVMSRK